MVHLNKKYIDHEQIALDHDYLANEDGIAVLGFLFNVSGTKVSIKLPKRLWNEIFGIKYVLIL